VTPFAQLSTPSVNRSIKAGISPADLISRLEISPPTTVFLIDEFFIC
jgi:hypothetical protein